jgi:transcriptional regulator with XRE-family HTH domain
MARAGLTGIIEQNPNVKTREFAGRSINLSALAREVGSSPSHLSNVFGGRRTPSMGLTLALAKSLAMPLDEFLAALQPPPYMQLAAPESPPQKIA